MRIYDSKFLDLDEKLCSLIAERFHKGGDREGGLPTREQLNEWGETYELDPLYLTRLFSALASPLGRPFMGPKNLRTVLPILRKARQDHVVYEITHMMQYENCSVVALEINSTDNRVQFGPPELLLDVSPGDYHVTITNNRGGGSHFEMGFSVTPPLPDDMSGLHFKLVPHVRFSERLEATILNERVEF